MRTCEESIHINLQDLSSADVGTKGGSIQIRLAASEFSDRKYITKLGIIVTIASISVALIVTASVCLTRKRFKEVVPVEGSLKAFRYRDMQTLTKNFSSRLGGGAFGSVFKGSLADGTMVAVKKLEGFRQGEKQLRAEVSTLGTVRHVNLIRLLGFCSERTGMLPIYEYMPNTSLDRYLFGSSHPLVLSWSTRYQIALGIARGLHYLHERCRDCIIHCDIKPENILLSDTFVPKVADFGLAKLMGRDFSRVLTTVRGTIGYLAPEWIAGTAITTKADVYQTCDIKPENILLSDTFVPKVADFGLAKLMGRDFSRVLTTVRGTIGYLALEWIAGTAITTKADVYQTCYIKPENILLSDTFVPKVADFGLAKLMGRDFSRVLTTVRGTIGYLAPEWIAGTAITTKADVYSFGMMLFEIVSGRRNLKQRQDSMLDFFPLQAAMKLTEGELEGLVDTRLGCDVDSAEVERACRVACWCSQDEEEARPSMATVVQVLEGLVEVNVPLVPRSLKLLTNQSTLQFSSELPSE